MYESTVVGVNCTMLRLNFSFVKPLSVLFTHPIVRPSLEKLHRLHPEMNPLQSCTVQCPAPKSPTSTR